MKIAFRVDANELIGTGHLMRCIELADTLKHNIIILFICKKNILINKLMINYSFKIISIDPINFSEDAIVTKQILHREKINTLVVDHYQIDKTWQEKVAPKVLIVIDDLANRKHIANLLIDTGDKNKRYNYLVPKYCHCLLGPKYAIIRGEFLSINNKAIAKHTNFSLFICFGGSDPDNHTLSSLQILSKIHFSTKICVVVGTGYSKANQLKMWIEKSKLKVKLFQAPNDFAQLMAQSKIIISAASSMLFEAATLNKTIIMIQTAENQSSNVKLFSENGAAIKAKISDLAYCLKNIAPNSSKLAQQAKRLCDGQGKYRITKEIIKLMEQIQ